VTDGQTDERTELRWLKDALKAVAAFARKKGAAVFQKMSQMPKAKASILSWELFSRLLLV